MRYLAARSKDVANGPGIRASIWLAGCSRHCEDCFNPEAWDFKAGKPLSDKAINKFVSFGLSNDIAGFSILGGEPMQQSVSELNAFMLKLQEANKPIWMWTGFRYEEFDDDEFRKHIIDTYIDVLVDGPFMKELADSSLRFRGSSNQRIIDIKKTIATGHIVELNY